MKNINQKLKSEWDELAPARSLVQAMLTVVPAVYAYRYGIDVLNNLVSGEFQSATQSGLASFGSFKVVELSAENILKRHGWHKDSAPTNTNN